MFAAAFILIGLPLGAWFVSRHMESTTPASLPPPSAPPKAPECALNPELFSNSLQEPAPVIDLFNQAGKEILDGSQFYFTAAGQDAVIGALAAEILEGQFRASRATVAREALSKVFPECNWQKPLEDFTAEQYQAWLSAWALSAAIEADAGIDLDVTPRTDSKFIHREDLGLLGLQNQLIPVGSLVLLNASDQIGDDAELLQATVASGAVDAGLNQEVIIESAPTMSSKHGVKQGDKYVVSTPWNVLAVLQLAQMQPNPMNFYMPQTGQVPR